MTKKAISQLKLLDSVMKESQRMRPPLLEGQQQWAAAS
ncbi:hypothetical protein EYZ11_013388 [Aspergillus tanneri]|uniref:Uncharacterized protein n=1 Tax=Aspergillus tanneri TaxID=1220188 RepID=A0A4S3IXT0_9EURO|nr:hypothetical protein EYZ11_013388 [Aspergillus tanneri]